jgi:hypothetical protein
MAKFDHGGAQVRLGSIPIPVNQVVIAQQTLHSGPLNAFPTAVNQSHDVESCLVRSVQVFIDDRQDVRGGEGMEIDGIFDRDANDFIIHLNLPGDIPP